MVPKKLVAPFLFSIAALLAGCDDAQSIPIVCLKSHVEPQLMPIIGPDGSGNMMMVPVNVCDKWADVKKERKLNGS